MLKPQTMVKLRIICPSDRLRRVIDGLYNARAAHIIEHKKDDALDIGQPLSDSSKYSDAVIKARSIMFQLGQGPAYKPMEPDFARIDQVFMSLGRLQEEKKAAESEIKRLSEVQARAGMIGGLGLPQRIYRKTEHTGFYVGLVDDAPGLRKEARAALEDNYELTYAKSNGKTVMAIFFDRTLEARVLELLRRYSFSELKVPKEQNTHALGAQIEALKRKLDAAKRKIGQIRSSHGKEIAAMEKSLSVLVEKSEAPLVFGATKNFSVVTAWVPRNRMARLSKSLEEATSGRLVIEELDDDYSAPVLLDNPKTAKPYEFLLRLFSMPSYRELDPTIFMFITFPLFFGFMLGDIGYGALTLIVFLILKRKIPGARDLLNIMVFCAISSIAFGMLFGEFFGFEISGAGGHDAPAAHDAHAAESHGFKEWISTWPLHRSADNAINLIILTLLIGVLHVNLGLVLGFVNIYRQHGFHHAILEKGSWLFLETGAVIVGLAMAGMAAKIALAPGLLLVAGAAVMLYKGEGVQGLVELPSVFVHIGSYMRLMAIGLASVGLAVVVNEQTGPLFSRGILWAAVAVIIFTLGHIINILLGLIGPFLHSLRLHYVEHFTKFYRGGGTEFAPFGAETNGGR